MLRSGSGKSDERGGKFHLGIVAAKLDGLLDESVAVDALEQDSANRAKPLLVGLCEITDVEIVESGWRTGLHRLRAGRKPA